MISKLFHWFNGRTLQMPASTKVVRYVFHSADAPADYRPAIKETIEQRCTADYARRLIEKLAAGQLSISDSPRPAGVASQLNTLATQLNVGDAPRISNATHISLISAEGPSTESDHLWLALAATRAIAQATGGLAVLPSGLVWDTDKNAAEIKLDGSPLSPCHLSMLYSRSGRHGTLSSVGLHDYGLPEFEFFNFDANLRSGVMHVANGLARELALRALSRTDVKRFVVPRSIHFTTADINDAYGGPGDEELEIAPIEVGLSTVLIGKPSFLVVAPEGVMVPHEVWMTDLVSQVTGGANISNLRDDDEELLKAIRRAREELPAVKTRYQAGLPDGATLMIKYRFPVTGEDRPDAEHMWVQVESWPDGVIHGKLVNDAVFIDGLSVGSAVSTPESDVEDWTLLLLDGTQEGGYTEKVVRSRG